MRLEISQETTMGGWTGYLAIIEEEKKIFNESLASYNGVEYKPLYASSQTVFNGTNYRFKCIASLLESEAVWESIIEVFKPIKGMSHIINITKL